MVQQELLIQAEQNGYIGCNGTQIMFRLFAFRGIMYMDITIADEAIVLAKRVIPNQWLLPHFVAQGLGNIRFETYKSDGEEYVWWEGFNTKYRLTAYTEEEIAEIESAEKRAEEGVK
jgi:hypothetical protein